MSCLITFPSFAYLNIQNLKPEEAVHKILIHSKLVNLSYFCLNISNLMILPSIYTWSSQAEQKQWTQSSQLTESWLISHAEAWWDKYESSFVCVHCTSGAWTFNDLAKSLSLSFHYLSPTCFFF